MLTTCLFFLFFSYENHLFVAWFSFDTINEDVMFVSSASLTVCTVLPATWEYPYASVLLWSRQTSNSHRFHVNIFEYKFVGCCWFFLFQGKSLETIKIQWSHAKVFETNFIIILCIAAKMWFWIYFLSFEWIFFVDCWIHLRNIRMVSSGQIYFVWQMSHDMKKVHHYLIILSISSCLLVSHFFVLRFFF